jgi:hypothetical protein
MNAQPLWDWINERHRITLRRRAGEAWPWTADTILQQYRFCNVFRELDTVTQWIERNIRQPYAEHPNLWFMLAIARQINHPPTLVELMEPWGDTHCPVPNRKGKLLASAWPERDWDLDRQIYAANIMDCRKARGEQVYTGAYMIRAESDPRKEWYSWSKQLYLTRIVLGKVWEAREGFQQMRDWADRHSPLTLQQVHTWFMQFHGWGGFMAYEVVTDLRHTRYLRNAPDILTWANAGPGALRGLNRLAGRPLNAPLKQQQACAEMQHLLTMSRKAVGAHVPLIEMRDIEHSLCETDKYLRVLNGEGRPRSLYHPPKGTPRA